MKDIHVAFKKTLVYSLIVGLVILVLTLTNFFSGFVGISSFKITIIPALISTFLFNPIKNKIHSLVDRLFYKTTYDYSNTIKNVSRKLSSTIDVKDINRFIVDTVFTALKLQQVYCLSAGSQYYEPVYFKAFKNKPDIETIQRYRLDVKSELINLLKSRNGIIIKEEMSGTEQYKSDAIKNELKPFHGEVAVPIVMDNHMDAVLILGGKLSGDIYRDEDMKFLKTISHQAALGMKSAHLYEVKLQSEKVETMGLVAATLAHEIKNPLASIKVFSQLLPEKYMDEEFRETFAEIVSKEIQRIDNLLTELIAFSKRSPLTLHRETIEITALLEDTLKLFSGQFSKSNIKVVKNYSEPLFIEGDRNRLKQALINFVYNSYQAMEKGGILEVKTAFNGKVNIYIIDNGMGILEKDMDKIFDPFFTTKEKGVGLGLSISKKIIEECNGKVSVISKPNQGTTFVLSFRPIKDNNGEQYGAFGASKQEFKNH